LKKKIFKQFEKYKFIGYKMFNYFFENLTV